MADSNHNLVPILFERIAPKRSLQRVADFAILALLLTLLSQRLYSLNLHGLPWLLAFLCESWFTFVWLLVINCKWNPIDFKTYPHHLSKQVDELPEVDMFVTTADPALEAPILTLNTVLSLMAVDYPSRKLACYVSDDGASPLTFYSLVEGMKFAKLWVPFCKNNQVSIRAPFRYFSVDEKGSDFGSQEFQQHRALIKVEYEKLIQKIEDASRSSTFPDLCGEHFQAFSNIDVNNHPSIIKVISDNNNNNKNEDNDYNDPPDLIYISREKRPKHRHNYKAGAMNVLTRVSGLMTNAPFILNVDCDMYVHNPRTLMHAMCLLLGLGETRCGFLQFPQDFYNGSRDYIAVLNKYMIRGTGSIQGTFYQGTGCFHRRKIIYGMWPESTIKIDNNEKRVTAIEDLEIRFGDSVKLKESVSRIFFGSKGFSSNPSNHLDSACKVAGHDYENGTLWGKEVGWMYGSTSEDVLTGLKIHSKGWKSVLCMLDPPGFLGCMPTDTLTALLQQKRWASGLLEIMFQYNLFYATLNGRLQFRQRLVYLIFLIWTLRSLPELCYIALPAYCIVTNSYFLPKGVGMCVPLGLFAIYNLYTFWEYRSIGATPRAWWVAQRMGIINSTTAWLFGLLSVAGKHLGISEPTFHITEKKQGDPTTDAGGFEFTDHPIFVPATAVALVHLSALATWTAGQRLPDNGGGVGLGEIWCSVWVVLCFWPFVEGLLRKGRNGIPASTIFKSAALALTFFKTFLMARHL